MFNQEQRTYRNNISGNKKKKKKKRKSNGLTKVGQS